MNFSSPTLYSNISVPFHSLLILQVQHEYTFPILSCTPTWVCFSSPRSYFNRSVLLISLEVDQFQQSSQLLPRTQFKGWWELLSLGPGVHHMHGLFPLDWCCDLLRQELRDFMGLSVAWSCYVAVNGDHGCAERDSAECFFQRFLCWGHECGMKGTTDWKSFGTANSKCLCMFFNKF